MDDIHPRLVSADPALAAFLPESMAREHGLLPQGREGRTLVVLVSNPHDFEMMDMVRFVLGACMTEVRFALTSRQAIREGVERMYGGAAR